jgi:hypothetical protein
MRSSTLRALHAPTRVALASTALALGGCAAAPTTGAEWIDPQFADISLRASTVLVVCEAADLPVKRLCQDVLAAEVTAMGATAIIAADSAAPGQRPMAEAQLDAARAAGARSILSTAISPDATVVNSGPSVGVGLGGYTGSGGWGSGSGVGVGFSLPVGGGQVQQALGATGALTNVASGKTMWTVRSSATPSGNMNAQVSQLGKSIVSAAQRAGFF